MLVGWGGNNGSTLTAAIEANKRQLEWKTRTGIEKANWYGSITQASTVLLGTDDDGNDKYVGMNELVPMVDPNNIGKFFILYCFIASYCKANDVSLIILVLDGWDISSLNIAESMERSQVLDMGVQDQVHKTLSLLTPRPSIYDADFIAANQVKILTYSLKNVFFKNKIFRVIEPTI